VDGETRQGSRPVESSGLGSGEESVRQLRRRLCMVPIRRLGSPTRGFECDTP
jgi:hypothetical protein